MPGLAAECRQWNKINHRHDCMECPTADSEVGKTGWPGVLLGKHHRNSRKATETGATVQHVTAGGEGHRAVVHEGATAADPHARRAGPTVSDKSKLFPSGKVCEISIFQSQQKGISSTSPHYNATGSQQGALRNKIT